MLIHREYSRLHQGSLASPAHLLDGLGGQRVREVEVDRIKDGGGGVGVGIRGLLGFRLAINMGVLILVLVGGVLGGGSILGSVFSVVE